MGEHYGVDWRSAWVEMSCDQDLHTRPLQISEGQHRWMAQQTTQTWYDGELKDSVIQDEERELVPGHDVEIVEHVHSAFHVH